MMKRISLPGAGLALILICSGCGREEAGFTREQYRAAATALFEKELYLEAVDMYREYLRSDVIPPEDVPKVLYQMGTIHEEKLRDPKAALAQYAVIKALYPGETFNNQLGKRMVASLEAMGRSVDATQARSRLTDFNPDTPSAPAGGGAVVAEVDGRKVTLGEIASAAGKLPDAPLERNQLVREYVAQMLMAEAARRKGLADRPEVKLRIGQLEDQVLAQAALTEEIMVAPPEGNDLRYYFEANKSRYQGTDSGATFESMEPKVRADWAREKQMGEYRKYVDRLLQTAKVRFYGANEGNPAP